MRQGQCGLCGRHFMLDDTGAGTCPSCGFALAPAASIGAAAAVPSFPPTPTPVPEPLGAGAIPSRAEPPAEATLPLTPLPADVETVIQRAEHAPPPALASEPPPPVQSGPPLAAPQPPAYYAPASGTYAPPGPPPYPYNMPSAAPPYPIPMPPAPGRRSLRPWLVALIIVVVVVLLTCAVLAVVVLIRAVPPASHVAPMPTVVPTPTATTGPVLPAGFTAYKDAGGFFTLGYPTAGVSSTAPLHPR